MKTNKSTYKAGQVWVSSLPTPLRKIHAINSIRSDVEDENGKLLKDRPSSTLRMWVRKHKAKLIQ